MFLAAVLGAADLVECLRRRAAQGSCWHIRINLRRICLWVQSLGIFTAIEVKDVERPSITAIAKTDILQEAKSRLGSANTKALLTQIQFSGSIRPCVKTGVEPTRASKSR